MLQTRVMNVMERDTGPAIVSYGDNEFTVMRPGRYVVCAVSGRSVALEALRYWSVVRQEPYAGPAEAARALGGTRS